MNPRFCRWIDRWTIDLAASRMPRPDGRDLHQGEAGRLLLDPGLFSTDLQPAAVEFDGPVKFRFASPHPSAYEVNNIVHGRFYRCGDDWRQRPTVLLLHGWNDVLNHFHCFPRDARRLNQMGLNAATLQLPWHFDRRPRDLGAWSNFLSADLLRTVEATRQAMADIRAFINWLSVEDCPFIGLWGVSMGAWLAGLTICRDQRIDAAVLAVPVARLDRLIDEVPFCGTIRAAMQGGQIDLRPLNLVSNTPVIDKAGILLIEAEHDLFVPSGCVEDLWRAWGQPEIWRHPSGHITILCVRGLAGRVIQWLAARAHERVAK